MNITYIPIVMVFVPITGILLFYNLIWFIWLRHTPLNPISDIPQNTTQTPLDYPLERMELSIITSESTETSAN